jgi:predicted CXXCH cytochrome family protein
MLKNTHIPAFLLVVFLSFPFLWAEEKPTERTENCTTTECHNSYVQKKHVHKPVALGVCKFCHKSVDPKEHSFKLFRTGKELCGSCHEEQTRDLETIPSVEQLMAKAPRIGRSKYLHKPLKEGQCVDCHNSHASENEFLISSSNIGDACKECHEMVENFKTPHDPVAKGECTKCHDSHSSDFENLLVEDQRQLCFSCHEGTKEELEKFRYVHRPVVERECNECHAPHGSNYYRLLVRNYPSEFYAPFNISNYDLCFSCHNQDIILVKETESLTDFRNGTLNLHYLHVNMPERGRTCRTCHATHSSDLPKHLRDKVPYGGWGIPIGFEKTETGGSCTPGCHNPHVYDRISPAVYPSDTDQAVSSSRGRGGTTGAPAYCSLKNLMKPNSETEQKISTASISGNTRAGLATENLR